MRAQLPSPVLRIYHIQNCVTKGRLAADKCEQGFSLVLFDCEGPQMKHSFVNNDSAQAYNGSSTFYEPYRSQKSEVSDKYYFRTLASIPKKPLDFIGAEKSSSHISEKRAVN